MQGIVQGELALNNKVIHHLDHCLGCLACENLCPSNVKYEVLIDSIREYTATQKPSRKTALLISALTRPGWQKILFGFLHFYQRSGLQWLARKTRLLKLLGLNEQDKLLAKLNKRLSLKKSYAAAGKSLGSVSLFTGCMGNAFEQKAILASISVLNKLSYDVSIPQQVCCGALHQHSGYKQQANKLAQTNMQLLTNNDTAKNTKAILFTASGCGAQLKSALKQSNTTVTSVLAFVQQHIKTHPVTFNPLAINIALHQPCSLQNVLKQTDSVTDVLNNIPQLKITELQSQCCGAAGKNMLTQTHLAKQVRQPLIEQINLINPEFVVTSNIGCLLHIQAGLDKKIQCIHPVELLEKSIKPKF